MNILIYIVIFAIGTIFGSFYNVIGYRVPKNESIINPPSHCPKCNHKLKIYELIPLISYIKQKGKCHNCQQNIPLFYPIFEALTGIVFLLTYIIFGLTPELIINLTFISLLIIITISDYNYMIIPDNILLFFGLLLIIEILTIYGPRQAIISIINGILSFGFMFILKKIGDFIFKKESMGGGDIKLLFIFGMTLSFPIAILSIFIGSIVGLPISLLLLINKSDHVIPFGPLLSTGAIILLLSKIDLNTIINFYNM